MGLAHQKDSLPPAELIIEMKILLCPSRTPPSKRVAKLFAHNLRCSFASPIRILSTSVRYHWNFLNYLISCRVIPHELIASAIRADKLYPRAFFITKFKPSRTSSFLYLKASAKKYSVFKSSYPRLFFKSWNNLIFSCSSSSKKCARQDLNLWPSA